MTAPHIPSLSALLARAETTAAITHAARGGDQFEDLEDLTPAARARLANTPLEFHLAGDVLSERLAVPS